MRRSFLFIVLLALFAVPPAFADGGPSPGVMQGWDGVEAPSSAVRYVAVSTGSDTVLAAVRTRGGRIEQFSTHKGNWGVPLVTNGGDTDGLSRDGRTLVLAEVPQSPALRRSSSFLFVDTRTLRQRKVVTLRGDFAFDALSPDARTLYLIQHVSQTDLTRYVVRAYDLERDGLLPGRIADRTQRGWVMQGYPIARATSADGRWAYTLYRNDGGYPFVHALDTVLGKAHCVGLPWRSANQDPLWSIRLSVVNSGRLLALDWPRGDRYLGIDTRTFRLVRPRAGEGDAAGWWTAGGSAAAALLLIVPLGLFSFRRRRRL